MSEQERAAAPVAVGQQTEVAVLAGGCFWGVEDILRGVPGVIDTDVGYTGGWLENPTYHDTHDSASGHAEAVRITFDPSVLSYEELLEKWFFRLHDPTTLNRQGNDVGTQYRSAIFPQSPEQREAAERVIVRVNAAGKWKRPVTTSIEPAATWYSAEAYHQDYLRKHPGGYSCHFLRDSRSPPNPRSTGPLEGEEPGLDLETAGEAGELAAGADHPVAGRHDREWIPAARGPYRARGAGMSDLGRHLGVGAGFPERNAPERAPHLLLERGARGIERQVELGAPPREVLGELPFRLAQNGVVRRLPDGLQPDSAGPVVGPENGRQAALARHQGEEPDRRPYLLGHVGHDILLNIVGRSLRGPT